MKQVKLFFSGFFETMKIMMIALIVALGAVGGALGIFYALFLIAWPVFAFMTTFLLLIGIAGWISKIDI